jgi:hypothetical protein
LIVYRGDRRLYLIRPHRRDGQRLGEQRRPLGDRRVVPPAPILFGQRDQIARGIRPGRASGVGQQHEREQSCDLAVCWQVRA